MKSSITLFLSILLTLTASDFPANARESKELIVSAAADLSPALQVIADNYQKKTGVTLKLSFGASGAITQQIQNGAPFDLFFSADMGYPRQLIASGLVDASSVREYAVGKLVLWVPAKSPLNVERKGMEILLDPTVQKISIANPQHAPYGRAAVAALKHARLYDRVSSRLVLGENISQAAQFVESGNAQAGFIALAHAVAPAARDKGKFWIVPSDFYPPLSQGVVIVTNSHRKEQAKQFLDYLQTNEAEEVLTRYGFTLPSK